MTVNEIETTLQSLYKRHENLNEATLLTLLKSGGWDEKMIRDAVHIHRRITSPDKTFGDQESVDIKDFLPVIQESPVFIPEVDSTHLLLDHYDHVDVIQPAAVESKVNKIPESEVIIEEKQSLVTPEKEQNTKPSDIKGVVRKNNEPPHNLPLKPFEATPHTWQFDRYKSVFYGDVEEEIVEEKKEVKQEIKPVQQIPVDEEKKLETSVHHVVHMAPAPLTRDDEKLVILAAVMLIAILLLLGYMYSQGRI